MLGWASARLESSSVIEMNKINLAEKFSLFDETWTPKLIGELNGQHVKLAKIKGEFVWHAHDDADEMFLVIKGSITIEMRDQRVNLNEGEFFIVPRGVEHRPSAVEEAHIMLFEPAGTVNTGAVEHAYTVRDPEWI